MDDLVAFSFAWVSVPPDGARYRRPKNALPRPII
jgi:hypothetical protein